MSEFESTEIVEALASNATWVEQLDTLDDRQKKDLVFAIMYSSFFNHGADGHNRFILITKLAQIIDALYIELNNAQEQIKALTETKLLEEHNPAPEE